MFSRIRFLFLLPSIALVASPVAGAAPPTAKSASTAPAANAPIDEIEAAARQAEQDADLTAEQKKQLAEVYRQALEQWKQVGEWRTTRAQYEAARQNAPRELEKLKSTVAQFSAESNPVVDSRAPLETLKKRLSEAEDRASAAVEEREELQTEQQRRTERWEEVRALDERAAHRESDLEKQLHALPSLDGETSATARASRLLLEAQRANAAAERAAYAAELPSYEATRELLRLRLDDAVRLANLAEKQAELWKDAVAAKSQVEAESKARDAKTALVTARTETLPLAEENERLTQLRQGPQSPAARLKEVRRTVASAQALLTKLRNEFQRMKQTAELSNELGQLLLNQRRQLPDTAKLEDEAQARKEEIAAVKLSLLELENRRSELADLDDAVRNTMLPLEGTLGPEEEYELGEAVRELLAARRGYLDDLIADQNALFNALVLEQDKTSQELLQTVRAYQTYIDEQILWVRSFPAMMGWKPAELSLAVSRLTNFDEWLRLPTRLWDDLRTSPQTWILFFVIYGIYAWSLGRLRGAIAQFGEAARRCYAGGFLPTLKVLALTVICALPAPAVLWFLSSRLVAWPGATEFTRAFASGMKTTALVWLSIALVRQALRRKGLADAHFGYSSTACDGARRMLWRLAAIGIPATFIAATCQMLGVVPIEASVGRAAFILGMLCLCRSMHVITHPERGLLQASRDLEDRSFQDQDDFRLRLRRLWYLGACAAPLVPAVLSTAGYHYTALQLTIRLQTTVWLLLGFALVRSLLLRALMSARHRLLLEQARQPKAIGDAPGAVANPVGPTLTLAVIDRQSRRLVNGFGALALAVGVWFVWVDMLPALKFLDRWQLYSYAVTTTEGPSATGDAPQKNVEITRWEWITAADLASAAIILLMAFIAARNLPGLLEITCLQWLPIDSGARYAATTVARYVIHVITIIAVCNVVGLQWSSIQWLAAAATVGLGFGLQEIFANFISGLIILFERPIRVGDTVTIGNVTGSVSRIRSRATTIVDGDRKELIVPNKEFITGQLINWTLSDDVLRTVLRVGVNHDADVSHAARLLLELAEANPLVLRDPEPTVACTQLGDQHLEIELRVFSSGTASLSPLRHQLNVAVLHSFHEAGIMLASPPRELILRTLEAIRPDLAADARKAA